jgi:hypothetical protein
MRTFLLAALASATALAAIDGTVVNKTTGKPQPGATVRLTRMTQGGMDQGTEARSGADGRFRLDVSGEGAHLLQVVHQGVSYNHNLSGGSSTGIEIAVYDVAAKPVPPVDQHMILVETDGAELVVNETWIVNNAGNTTYADPANGSLRFFVPAAAGEEIRVRAIAPQGMPVERTPKPAKEKGVWMIDYPVKPGETRFDVSYKLAVKEPVSFSSKILHPGGQPRLIVPQGITAEGDALKFNSREPSTQAAIFDITAREYTVALTGSGRLKSVAGGEGGQGAEEDGPRITQINPRIASRQWWIIGLGLLILGLGFWALYQKGGAQPGARPKA